MNQSNILIVDDEQSILNSLNRLFRKEGYKVFTATSGKSGLEIFKESNIHLVISDYRMPRMNGVEFLQKVRELYPDTIRIVLSGYADVDTIIAAINKGEIYKFITKPWNDEELKLTIRRSLEQYELIQENRRLTEKIRLQNEELEKQVQERTATLALSQEILENLPIPIMGISTEGIVVFINKKVKEIFQQQTELLVGSNMEESLPPAIYNLVQKTLKTKGTEKSKQFEYNGTSYNLKCSTLSDSKGLKGAILVIESED